MILNREQYLKKKEELERLSLQGKRGPCLRCLRPESHCYCDRIKTFDPKIEFAILIHPIEHKRRIATGRMAHLSLPSSHLILGLDYSHCPKVNALLARPKTKSVLLYPGPNSTDLGSLSRSEREIQFGSSEQLVVFVIDGTWNTARSTVRMSQNLARLPRVCFTPKAPSRFSVRKQPADFCHSTIEAIHHTIELLGPSRGLDLASRAHDSLLNVLDWMVSRQLEGPKNLRVFSRTQ